MKNKREKNPEVASKIPATLLYILKEPQSTKIPIEGKI